MDITEIYKIFEFISAFLLILFSVFLITQKRRNRLASSFLALFLLSRAIILISFALWNYEQLFVLMPDVLVLGYPVLFLYAPFLFLYTQAGTRKGFKLKWIHSFHFLPFAVIFIYFILIFHFQTLVEKTEILITRSWYHPVISNSFWLWVQFGIYAAGCCYLLVGYKKAIVQFNSSYNRNKLSWLSFLVLAFLVWKVIFISGYLFGVFNGDNALLFKLFVEVSFLFYASMIVYKGLQWPDVVLGLKTGKMYQTSPLSNKDKQSYLIEIEQFMQSNKPYMNPDLNLNELAERCNIPVHYVSQVLNEQLNQNFYTFINNYRIDEAKRILTDPHNNDMTILEILYEVGFNSKSVFNTAFKKQVNMTPGNFKKAQQKIG